MHNIFTYNKKDPLDGALDLMRRLPPPLLSENLAKVLALVPDLTDDLLAAIDQPLVSQICKGSGKPFLLCDYNRDGSAYRWGFLGIGDQGWKWLILFLLQIDRHGQMSMSQS
jgi:hypothetical protein